MMTFKCGYKSFERNELGKTQPGVVGGGGWLMSTFTNGHESWLIDVISYEMSIKNHAINIETHSPARPRTNDLCHWSIGSCSFDWKWNAKRIFSRSQIDARINFSFLFCCGRKIDEIVLCAAAGRNVISKVRQLRYFRYRLCVSSIWFGFAHKLCCLQATKGQVNLSEMEKKKTNILSMKNANRFVRHTRAAHKMYVWKLIKKKSSQTKRLVSWLTIWSHWLPIFPRITCDYFESC